MQCSLPGINVFVTGRLITGCYLVPQKVLQPVFEAEKINTSTFFPPKYYIYSPHHKS